MAATLKTFILMAGLTAFFIIIGGMIAGPQGAGVALMIALATNAFAYWNADKMVLRMAGAKQIDELQAPNFYGIVRDLARRANLPMPKVYLIDTDQPNAFATGRNPHHAAVAATTGLLNRLTPDEIAGVMAHELGHIRNRDTLTMTITATIAGAISMLAQFAGMFGRTNHNGRRFNPLFTIIFVMLAPVAAMLVQMAISRTREYEADRAGADISAKPEALATALNKIANHAQRIPNPRADRNPATAHMYIINPLHFGRMSGLFATHPATEDRIRRLMDMAGRKGREPGDGFGLPQGEDRDVFTPNPDEFKNPWSGAA